MAAMAAAVLPETRVAAPGSRSPPSGQATNSSEDRPGRRQDIMPRVTDSAGECGTPWPMPAREHHFFFAKKMIPTHTFQSTDKMFSELTGPKREAFLFWLWKEAGKGIQEQLPHVDNVRGPDGIPRVAKLEVVGAVKPAGNEVIVISMPPALNPNEALFLALVRRPTGVSVFFHERCMGNDHATVSPNEAVLAEVRADGSRLNHGFKNGIDLEAFKRELGAVLGVSLDGIETSLPAITAAAFVGGGGGGVAPGAGGPESARARGTGNFLALCVAIAALAPLVLKGLGMVGMAGLVFPVWRIVDPLLGTVIGITLLVWLYRVHAARRGQTSLSPGWSIGWWFVPVLNIFMIPSTLSSAWRGVMGTGALGLAWLWWIFYIPAMQIRAFETMFTLARTIPGYEVPHEMMQMAGPLFQYGWAIELVAYGLLYYIVKTVSSKL